MKSVRVIGIVVIFFSTLSLINILNDMQWFYVDTVLLFEKFDIPYDRLMKYETVKFTIIIILLFGIITSSILTMMKKNIGRIALISLLGLLIAYMFIGPLFYIEMPIPRSPDVPINNMAEMYGYFNIYLRIFASTLMLATVIYLSSNKVRAIFKIST